MNKKNQHKTTVFLQGKQKYSLARNKKICTIVCSFLFPAPLYATTLTNVAELAANSIRVMIDSPNDTYQLKTGTYDIASTNALISINHMLPRNIQMTVGTTFTLGDALGAQIDHLLQVNKFNMLDGTLNAHGGATAVGERNNGIQFEDIFSQAAGIINTYGGIGDNAYGISGSTNALFTQTGGTVNAYGGTGNNAYGLGMTSGTLTQNGGIINASGGSGNDAHGFRMATLDQSGGHITALGGSGSQASGAWIGTFNQNGTATLTATGGSGVAAHGLYVQGAFTQNGAGLIQAYGGTGNTSDGLSIVGSFFHNGAGRVEATGGTATGTRGIAINGSYTMDNANAVLVAKGGSNINAHGVWTTLFNQITGSVTATGGTLASGLFLTGVGNKYTQTAGSLTATGFTGANATGVQIADNFEQAGAGTVYAIAGSGANAHGISVGQQFLQSGAGGITATGVGTAHGINVAQTFTQSGAGTITATGSATGTGNGLNTLLDITQSAGTMNFTGGGGATAYGAYTAQDFIQSGAGTVFAQAGSGANAHGIHVGKNFTQSGAGALSATGVGTAHGIDVVQNFTQSGAGTITATGGATGTGNGLNTLLDITQSAGTMNFTGGGGATAYGAYTAQDFIQSGAGAVFAMAGTGADAYGLRANRHFTQTGGSFTATASDAVNGYAAYVHETATIDGTLTVTPNMGGGVHNPALYVQNNNAATTGINFGASSMLHLELDGNTQRSGLVRINQGNTTITAGARVGIGFVHNIYSLPLNKPISMVFLENDDAGATIANPFQFLNTHPTLNWNITQTGNDYYLTVTRTGKSLNVGLPINAENLINAFPNLAGLSNAESAPLRSYADIFENALTAEEAKYNARFLQHNLTPHAFTRVPSIAVQGTEFVRDSMHRNLNNLRQNTSLMPGGSDALVDTGNNFSRKINNREAAFYQEQNDLGWQMWMDNHGQLGRLKARTSEYLDAKQHTIGMTTGARRVFQSGNSIAIAGYYLNNSVNTDDGLGGNKTDLRTQSYGVSAGLSFLLPEFDMGKYAVMPRLEVMTTYSFLDIEQERYVFSSKLDSNTNGNLYQGHAMLYTPFMLTEKTLLAPEIGMTYTFVDIDDFKEQNHNNLGLNTSTKNYNSLLMHLGISAETAIGSASSLYGGIRINKDLLENQVKLNNYFRSVPQVAFQTIGEKNNGITAHIRMGMNVTLRDNMFLNSEYIFGVSEDNQTHSLGLSLKVKF